MKKIVVLLFVAVFVFSIPVFAEDYSSPDVIKKVQESLNSAGYNCGTPDGVAGSGTRTAIKKYREDHNLTAGETIDDELAQSLGIASGTAPEDPSAVASPVHISSTEYGDITFVRYEVHDDDLFLVWDYVNTTSETVAPSFQYYSTLFQDGREISVSFSLDMPDDCDSGVTQIRPGASLRYASVYGLTSNSPVEVETKALLDFYDATKQSFVINLQEDSPVYESEDSAEPAAPATAGADNATDASEDYKTMYEDLQKEYDDLQKQFDDLQGKYDEIEKEYNTLKETLQNLAA